MSSNFNIILNSSNVVNDNTNSSYQYNFLSGGFQIKKGTEIAVASVTIPYSNFNVSAVYYNNASYQVDLSGDSTYIFSGGAQTITMPDGFYTVDDINDYFQLWAIQNQFYKTNNATTQAYYYISFSADINTYSDELICLPVESAPVSGWTYPANFPFSSGGYTPQVIISSTNNFGSLLGLLAGSYPASATTTVPFVQLSNTIPNATPVNNYLIRCNIAKNNVTTPGDVLDSMPITAPFGSNINYTPYYPKFITVQESVQQYLTVTFTDQNYNIIHFNDNNVLISLLMKVP